MGREKKKKKKKTKTKNRNLARGRLEFGLEQRGEKIRENGSIKSEADQKRGVA